MPQRPGARGPLARLVQPTEFERALRARSRASTAHFAVHHVAGSAPKPDAGLDPVELSTSRLTTGGRSVDDSLPAAPEPAQRLGAVVPKRHARRAVTRSLLKRQIYGVAERHRDALEAGVWVVRLRAPFDRGLFPSAASDALKACARGELEALFGAATATPSTAP